MRSPARNDVSAASLRLPRAAWRALFLALAFGAIEWLALARSRGADRLAATRRRITRR